MPAANLCDGALQGARVNGEPGGYALLWLAAADLLICRKALIIG